MSEAASTRGATTIRGVNPILPVGDVEEAVTFYDDALGSHETLRYREPPSYAGVSVETKRLAIPHAQARRCADILPQGLSFSRRGERLIRAVAHEVEYALPDCESGKAQGRIERSDQVATSGL